ncbi:MAG TPA: hypothetical protein VFQ85_01915 [Mycobacteriales bacterium]|jgi:hypothetical protein|nr:hypothetical protein [Mycobacteriales bacterium]
MNTDDKIRAILRLEADAVEPSPAGWNAITDGIAVRRRRTRWVWASGLAGAVALVAAVAVLVTSGSDPRTIREQPATQPPSASATSTPAPSATATVTPPAPAGDATPLRAIWPLTTRGEVRAWQADHAAYPSLATPEGAALAFARTYLGVADAAVAPVQGQVWAVHRNDPNGQPYDVSRLTVQGFGDGGTAPFVVTLATAPGFTLGAPAAGAAVTSPVEVRGTYRAVDPSFTVRVRADGAGSAPVELATERATTSPPDVLSATLAFTTPSGTGSVLVTNASSTGGGISGAAAVPVTFARATAAAMPETFVSSRGGRLAVFSTASGKLLRYLTAFEPGGGSTVNEVSADGRTVLYGQGVGTCATEIRSVPVAGGPATTVVRYPGDAAVGPASRRGDVLAFGRDRCDSGEREVVIRAGGPDQTYPLPARAELLAGPAVGGRFVAFSDTSTGGSTLRVVDSLGELADATVTTHKDCRWAAVTWGRPDSNERPTLVLAKTCDDGTGLYRYDEDGLHGTEIGDLGTLDVRRLDESADGGHVLLSVLAGSDADRHWEVWTWSGGTPHRINTTADGPAAWH